MSKLDGNERWKSKMLLTEHQEQYEGRAKPKTKGRPTPEELTMIRDYVLLPHMLTMIEKSMAELNNSRNLAKRLHLATTQVLMNRINRDMHGLRRELSRRQIRVVGDEQVDLIVYHRFFCRGYEDKLGIVREVMRAEISVRLARYFGEIARWLDDFDRQDSRPDGDAGVNRNERG